jgi:hypothetical protein
MHGGEAYAGSQERAEGGYGGKSEGDGLNAAIDA